MVTLARSLGKAALSLWRGGQRVLILCRKVVRNPPDPFGRPRMTLILKYYLGPPPSPSPGHRARDGLSFLSRPLSLSLFSSLCLLFRSLAASHGDSSSPLFLLRSSELFKRTLANVRKFEAKTSRCWIFEESRGISRKMFGSRGM